MNARPFTLLLLSMAVVSAGQTFAETQPDMGAVLDATESLLSNKPEDAKPPEPTLLDSASSLMQEKEAPASPAEGTKENRLLNAAESLMAPEPPADPVKKPASEGAVLEAAQILMGGKPTPPTEEVKTIADETGEKSYGTLTTIKTLDGETTMRFKVAEGASLSAIAGLIYGDAMKYPLIYEANKENLTSPNRVSVGTVLVIPVIDDIPLPSP